MKKKVQHNNLKYTKTFFLRKLWYVNYLLYTVSLLTTRNTYVYKNIRLYFYFWWWYLCRAEKQLLRVRAHEGAVGRWKSQWTTDFSHMTCSNSSFSLTMVTPRLTSLLFIGYVVCFPLATCPSLVLWAYASATITEFNHAHSSGDIPISSTGCTCFQHPPYSQHLCAWWNFGNPLVDIILERMQLSKHPLTHSTCGHDDISVITPVLSIYLSTTSAVFTPAGHVNILHIQSSWLQVYLSLNL